MPQLTPAQYQAANIILIFKQPNHAIITSLYALTRDIPIPLTEIINKTKKRAPPTYRPPIG